MSFIQRRIRSLNDLPNEIIVHIFSYLDYQDLVRCSFVNKRCNELSRHDRHWEKLCQQYWMEAECPLDIPWKDYFAIWYRDMGKYIDCYVAIKTAWDKILKFVDHHCPSIRDSLNDGASEKQLNFAESVMNIKLPNDLRCSLRLYNGQHLTSQGIMGSIGIHNHYKSETLMDIETMLSTFEVQEGVRGCVPLTLCIHSGETQFLALTDEDGYTPNTIFYITADKVKDNRESGAFITASSYEEWLVKYSNSLESGDFVVMHRQPFRFHHDPTCVTTTSSITVSVATCFLPELSNIYEPKFFHAYRITMSMSPDAPKSETCQLEARHWIITDENGLEEHVYGSGVVGEYPLMFPGAIFSWVSCTTFATSYGNMRGAFLMRNLISGERTEIKCPVFHMKCLPYITAEERLNCRDKVYGKNKSES